MKISLNWIQEYCKIPDLPRDLKAFCDKLDLTGTGVEGITKIGAEFDNIVTARIIKKTPHPDSDHMFVAKVDVGGDEPLQIVCGAQNFKQGDHVVTAKIGAVLPGDFKIKKSKLRGVMSMGMNCSEEELGLSDSSDGIMILPENAPVGVPIAEYLGFGDTVIDTEITPNRPDCLSVVGCAREIAAIYNTEFSNPLDSMAEKIKECEVCDLSKQSAGKIKNMPTVKVEESSRCPRYSARLITGVKIAESPQWLVSRLNSMGARSINNIVDITNYILYLFGQPLHAFDADKLLDGGDTPHIVVRPAHDGEKFTTLDGVDRVLESDMTVISTPKKAVALAGVMGGLDSEVTEQTTNILLETATFSPAHTSRTSRTLDLISESSMRYERRVDDVDIDKISAAAAMLIAKLGGGKICSSCGDISDKYSLIDEYDIPSKPKDLLFRINRFNQMMGVELDRDFIVTTLCNLGCAVSVNEDNDGVLNVISPTYRPDLEREIDLFEEVIRIFGEDKIPSTMPKSEKRVGHKTKALKALSTINSTMIASGVNETVTYSFANVDDWAMFDADNNQAIKFQKQVSLINPMNANETTMRQTLMPGLLRSVSYNLNHGVSDVSLYECGAVFYSLEGEQKPKEEQRLTCVLCGSVAQDWNSSEHTYDFFDAKGIIENLIDALNIKKLRFKVVGEGQAPHLHPGKSAYVYSRKQKIGWVGEVHPDLCDKFDIDKPFAAFELDLDALISLNCSDSDFDDIPRFPGIEIDVAFVVDKTVSNEMMMQRITSAGGKLLTQVHLFDVYSNEKHVGLGKKSMAYRLKYTSPDKTLTKEKIDKVHNKLIAKVCKSTGGEVRS